MPKLVEELAFIADYYESISDVWRARAYSNAVKTISKIKNFNPCKNKEKLPGIGKGIQIKIDEYCQNGTIGLYQELLEESQEQIITSEFRKIWGVGPNKSKELYDSGYRSIRELKKHPELFTEAQNVYLQHFNALQKRIPRKFIKNFEKKLQKIIPYNFDIAGSYRRGLSDSGDIDILIESNNINTEEIVEILNPYLFYILAMKDEKILAIGSFQKKIFRLDIEIVPPDEYITTLVYFTGSKEFNIQMRSIAKKLGYKLDQHALWKNKKKITFESEKELFDILGMEYLAPEER